MLKKEETAWSDGVLLICNKCAKAIPAASLKEAGSASDNLKFFLKNKLKESGEMSKVRVVTSSCLDICIDGTQGVSFASTSGPTESFAIHPEEDREELLKLLKSKMK
jgi:hypothetical protein